LLDFIVQGEISEAETPTIWMGATPSRLISNPPPSSPIFTLDALPAATFPIYAGLGHAPNMLACTPSGLVCCQHMLHNLEPTTTSQPFYGPFSGTTRGEPVPVSE